MRPEYEKTQQPRPFQLSFEGRLMLLILLVIVLNAVISTVVFSLFPDPVTAAIVGLFFSTLVGLALLKITLQPVNRVLRALIDGMQSFKDSDFSVSIAMDRNDEIGDLIKAHNEVKEVLRRDRLELSQKELLLETVNQTTPIAMFLVNSNNKVTYSNTAARKMLFSGKPLEGLDLLTQVEARFPELKDAFSQKNDGLYSFESKGEVETYHISWRNFKLHGQRHDLYLVKEMTRELNRQEVATWKKVIRVISHELNNSLTPISSLAHSGQIMLSKSDANQDVKIDKVLRTIEERANYLKQFIDGYARFAKLPKPQIQSVPLHDFVENIVQTTEVKNIALPIAEHVRFDPVQIQQVLINLIKNALESGSKLDDVAMAIDQQGQDLLITISDGGKGMTEEELHNALVPFYSTKVGGSGLGLPLCREIIEAHGGKIYLNNRSVGGLIVRVILPQT